MKKRKKFNAESSSDPAGKIVMAVWYGIGMTLAAGAVFIPYILFYDSLPSSIKSWLGPKVIFFIVVAVGLLVIELIKSMFSNSPIT